VNNLLQSFLFKLKLCFLGRPSSSSRELLECLLGTAAGLIAFDAELLCAIAGSRIKRSKWRKDSWLSNLRQVLGVPERFDNRSSIVEQDFFSAVVGIECCHCQLGCRMFEQTLG
jgi:hypothetical protein